MLTFGAIIRVKLELVSNVSETVSVTLSRINVMNDAAPHTVFVPEVYALRAPCSVPEWVDKYSTLS
jgi:hypothetical protein